MSVTTIAHLRTAVIEALTTDRTATYTRAIPAAYIFVRGMPPGFPADLRSQRARNKPGAFVWVARVTPRDGLADELGSDHLYDVLLVISRDYYLGYEHGTDIDAAHNRAIDDLNRLRSAICWPGALTTTAAGSATGIAAGAMRPVGDQSVVSVERMTGRDRLLNARDTFTCPILYTP